MAKINIGKTFDNAKSRTSIELSSSSRLEINIGDAHDMSSREVEIIEREVVELSYHLEKLLSDAQNLQNQHANTDAALALQERSKELVNCSKKIVAERRWYSVSAKGVIEAAKALGEAASPIVATAIRILELLQKAKI